MLTIFTLPKPFEGHSRLIQTNAIRSWSLLQPRPQIILFGDEPGTAALAGELNLQHAPRLDRNPHGTPLLNGVFAQAQTLATQPILAYVNADIILLNDFMAAIDRLQAAAFSSFLMIGRRVDLDLAEPVNFEDPTWETGLRRRAAREGVLAPVVCKDYFVFPRPLYAHIPAFAVGRGNWDNWMVYHAHQANIPVIEATGAVTALHQNHGYAHLAQGRGEAYVTGEEARQNAHLAGGMRLVKGSAATWRLTPSGLKRNRLPPLLTFLTDLPRFSRLLIDLFWPNKPSRKP